MCGIFPIIHKLIHSTKTDAQHSRPLRTRELEDTQNASESTHDIRSQLRNAALLLKLLL